MSENQRFWVYAALAALLSGQMNDEPKLFNALMMLALSLGFFVAACHALLGPLFQKVFRRNEL